MATELLTQKIEALKLENIDSFKNWSDKSNNIPFESTEKCIGNGEKKLAKELDISNSLGGQNSTVDLFHQDIGHISVKDMTNDDCTLGTEGCNNMRKMVTRPIFNNFINWAEKYQSECPFAKKCYDCINKKYGR